MTATKQPTWRLVANLGDVNPVDYGGTFVLADATCAYDVEVEVVQPPADDDDAGVWTVYRFPADRQKLVEDPETHTVYLVSEQYRDTWPYPASRYDAWFHKDLAGVASYVGSDLDSLRAALCSADPTERAQAYVSLADYHGYDNFDSYPLQLTRKEATARYRKAQYRARKGAK